MELVRVLYQDPFSPMLKSSPAFAVTDEQRLYVREVLDIACSDSRFAQKAYDALVKILTGGSVVTPEVTSITPNTAVLGSPSFTLHVRGTGFDPLSKIVWNGSVEPTVYVSATELTTTVDMSTATTPITIPVGVQNSNGVTSASTPFTLTSPPLGARKSVEDDKHLIGKEHNEVKDRK